MHSCIGVSSASAHDGDRRPFVRCRCHWHVLRDVRAYPDLVARDVLSAHMVRVIRDLAEDWRRLDERIDQLSSEIAVLARQDAGCERLMSVPGIGPIISSAMVASAGWRRACRRKAYNGTGRHAGSRRIAIFIRECDRSAAAVPAAAESSCR